MNLSKITSTLEQLQSLIDYGDKKQLLLTLHNSEVLVERDENSITVKIIKS